MTEEIKGRAKGGVARAAKLTSEQRSQIARNAAKAKHAANKTLEAIRKGNFKDDFGIDVDCYVLNDEKKTAVISQRGMAEAIGFMGKGGNNLPRFIERKNVSPFIGSELREKLSQPIVFKRDKDGSESSVAPLANGYDVTILIDLCNAIVDADNADALSASQANIAKQARVILGASAKSGIQNLVYKIAGYDTTKEEVIAAFRAFVQDEARKYEKEFPPELYLAWAKLYNITPPVRGRSWKHRHLTIDHIYHPLAKSDGKLLSLLREAKESTGGGKKLFQFLNEVGTRALRMHLGRVLEMAESAKDVTDYESKIEERFGSGQQSLKL